MLLMHFISYYIMSSNIANIYQTSQLHVVVDDKCYLNWHTFPIAWFTINLLFTTPGQLESPTLYNLFCHHTTLGKIVYTGQSYGLHMYVTESLWLGLCHVVEALLKICLSAKQGPPPKLAEDPRQSWGGLAAHLFLCLWI